jgi:hypothetical protein
MNKSEFRTYHDREATRLRSLVANATTPALKARLLEEAEKHELLALGERQLSGSLALKASQSIPSKLIDLITTEVSGGARPTEP